MSKPQTAILFPGQGSQAAGMDELVRDATPELFELASEVVGEDPFARADEATCFAQPAIYAASVAAWVAADRPSADLLAGHSLGELTALAVGGAFSLSDGLRIAAERGRLMELAARESGGGMLAVIGDRTQAEELAEEFDLLVANENSPEQVVLSGPTSGIAEAEAVAAERDLRAVVLKVRGAFHSDAMAPAQKPFDEFLASVEISAPATTVLGCADGTPVTDPRHTLVSGLVRPVRWDSVLAELNRLGVTRFLDAGPGRVMSGLVKRTLSGTRAERLAQMSTAGSTNA
ncbi:ACP S-malonyltransferase [soil metagenome]